MNPYDGLPEANSTLFKRVQSTTGFGSFQQSPSLAGHYEKQDNVGDGGQSLATKASTVKIQNQLNENSEAGSPLMRQKSGLNPQKVQENNVGFGDFV